MSDEIIRRTDSLSGLQNLIFDLERQLTEVTANFERECQNGDRLAEALGVPRTEGGSLRVQRMLNVIEALRAGGAK
ncbi:hypothetical protein UFOVP1326_29 [uncultured Caudovirales phage]|uniref:Uncharacterized protein n=1 Tax=uncultured Caudovirales phage TaxID=2100421 RepID=A0A6J5RY21_9CAUD|nr:hypothetical protein UFOVP1326_29 [uncultured Caudovirales phage]CAB4212424.1 hypothetical protein UFOVP1436_10 [uncultured Caudovirales phage]